MKVKLAGRDFYVAVISHKRSHCIEKMASICGKATWYVAADEVDAYEDRGAPRVIGSGGLCRSRNAALEDGFAAGLPVIQLSDDLKKLEFAVTPKEKRLMSFEECASVMLSSCESAGAMLAGVAPTSNAFFFNPKKPVSTNSFIVGDMILVRKNPLRFDENMRLKEDYDYTLQHLRKYGVVARANAILATFVHRSNPGGACDYRTSSLEQEMIALLRSKWPGMIRDNPRRKDEILLNT